MKIIFLDIDGVLNSASSWNYFSRLNKLGLADVLIHETLCPISVSNLNHILEELPEVKIVISSSWRNLYPFETLVDILDSNGVSSSKIIGVTPKDENRYRGKEIEAYLKSNPEITQFVIVDDDSDMEPYMDRFVKTVGRNGLTWTDAEKVAKMLGDKND